MTRVPTYASSMNLLSSTMKTKEQVNMYSYQSVTGLKSDRYSGYGAQAYNIVSLESSAGVVDSFIENNKNVEIKLKTMDTALTSIIDSVSSFKSSLNSLTALNMNSMVPDYTGGEISFISNNTADYVGKNITLDGVQYTFSTDGSTNVDINGLTTAEDIMQALNAAVQATKPNAEIVTDGNKMTFPLHTVNGTSTILKSASVVQTGKTSTMSDDQYQIYLDTQNLAFSSMQLLADTLNLSINGQCLFGGGSTNEPVSFKFSSLEEFQAYYDGINIKYPSTSNAALCSRSVNVKDTGNITFGAASGNEVTITAGTGSFLTETLSGGASTTGALKFDSVNQTIKAEKYGAFTTLKAGDTLVLEDETGATKSYTIENVSSDGKTITVDKGITRNDTITATADLEKVQFSTSFPQGTVIEFDGLKGLPQRAQVLGVSDDGKSITVSMDVAQYDQTLANASTGGDWSIQAQSYFNGGSTTSRVLVSDSQTLTMDTIASDSAFEKLFRALGSIAQGNLIDMRNPAEELNTGINSIDAEALCNEVMALVMSATSDTANSANTKNSDLYTVQLKIDNNILTLGNVTTNQKTVKNNLETSIAELKNVDKTTAATNLLLAESNLEASYAVLQSALTMSLLDYIK